MRKSMIAGVAAAALLLSAVQAGAATVTTTRAWQYEDAAPAALEVDNLIGDVRIERGTAAGFHVSVTVTAEAASEREAREIAEAVGFNAKDAGSSSAFQVLLPQSRFPLVYRPGGPEGWFSGRMYVSYLGEKRRFTGDADEGVKVRVDILVRAPADSRLDVRNVFGDASADGFSGELRLDGTSGRLSSTNGSGRVDFDSGSGEVSIRDCRCRISVDTGSGPVAVTGGEGELDADTGSGGVSVGDFKGSVRANTGSGGVKVSGLSGASELVADTGSGSVRVAGDLSGLRRLDIDTGSGSVTLESGAWPAMELVVDTGSGGTTIDIPGAEVRLGDDRRQVVRIGEGGFRGIVDTGSGSVSIRTVPAPAR